MCRICRVTIFHFNSKTQWQITDVSVTLRQPCLCPSAGQKDGVSLQRSINLGDPSLNNARMKNSRDRILCEVVFINHLSYPKFLTLFIEWVMIFSFDLVKTRILSFFSGQDFKQGKSLNQNLFALMCWFLREYCYLELLLFQQSSRGIFGKNENSRRVRHQEP